ncbi:MAG: polysaccharide deacetylase family protein [Candidatus Pacebacteria bacterium]|nr:polysaccharide deacetylase family protein [Candidatus Paceibacterota bacterium]
MNLNNNKIFRIDDVGASTKQFEQYGKWKIGNFWFLKRSWPFKKWGPYKELTANEWENVFEVFEKNNIKSMVAITASWVEKDSSLTPFPQKFPEQAAILKKALQEGKVEIANHGLTHCIVGKHLPRFWGSNRKFHREFWPDLPQAVHTEHILKSQEILESYFERPITIFVPPGNVWSYKTYLALRKTNIKKVISSRYMIDSNEKMQDIEFIDDKNGFFCLHDQDIYEKNIIN